MGNIAYIIEFAVNDGAQDQVREMLAGATAAIQGGEPGTLEYRTYISADGKRCIAYEVYADDAAFFAHLENMGEALPKLLAIAPVARVEVLGEVSAQVQEALSSFGASFNENIAGFAR